MIFVLNMISFTVTLLVVVGSQMSPFGSPLLWLSLSVFSLTFSVVTLMLALFENKFNKN